jgi:hypothetical protein
MLKLHAGVSKKVGLPGFSSASASCTIEAELDSSLLTDTAGFQIVVQRAYQSCEKAVQDQITRLTSDNLDESSQPQVQTQEVTEVRTSPAIRGVIDLVGMLRERFGLTTADELGIRQASNLIDELKGDEPAATPTNGNGA